MRDFYVIQTFDIVNLPQLNVKTALHKATNNSKQDISQKSKLTTATRTQASKPAVAALPTNPNISCRFVLTYYWTYFEVLLMHYCSHLCLPAGPLPPHSTHRSVAPHDDDVHGFQWNNFSSLLDGSLGPHTLGGIALCSSHVIKPNHLGLWHFYQHQLYVFSATS